MVTDNKTLIQQDIFGKFCLKLNSCRGFHFVLKRLNDLETYNALVHAIKLLGVSYPRKSVCFAVMNYLQSYLRRCDFC